MTRRRFGSVSKVREGRYRVFWTDALGTRRSAYVDGTLADADRYLSGVELGILGAGTGITWGDYWEAVVLPSCAGLEAKTMQGYRRAWRRLEPSLARRAASALTPRQAQAILDGFESPSVQRVERALLRKMCRMAVRDGILQRDPTEGVRLRKAEPRGKLILEPQEVVSYVSGALGYRHAHLVVLEMMAGLRHEEACAVTAASVSEEGGRAVLSVSEARLRIDGENVSKSTKNRFSRRSVPLSATCTAMLDGLLPESAESINPESAARNWRKWCERRGMPYVRMGDMRSNFASHACIAASKALVDLYIGHSDGGVTDRHYKYATRAALDMVADGYDAVIAGGFGAEEPIFGANDAEIAPSSLHI